MASGAKRLANGLFFDAEDFRKLAGVTSLDLVHFNHSRKTRIKMDKGWSALFLCVYYGGRGQFKKRIAPPLFGIIRLVAIFLVSYRVF